MQHCKHRRKYQVQGGRRRHGGGGVVLPSSTLFNLCDIQLEEVIEPCHKLLPNSMPVLERYNFIMIMIMRWDATNLDSPILREPNAAGINRVLLGRIQQVIRLRTSEASGSVWKVVISEAEKTVSKERDL